MAQLFGFMPCGRVQKKELSERVHCCPCGYIEDRDVAAAQVMLNWVLYGSTVFGTSIVKRGELGSTPTPTYFLLWWVVATQLEEA